MIDEEGSYEAISIFDDTLASMRSGTVVQTERDGIAENYDEFPLSYKSYVEALVSSSIHTLTLAKTTQSDQPVGYRNRINSQKNVKERPDRLLTVREEIEYESVDAD